MTGLEKNGDRFRRGVLNHYGCVLFCCGCGLFRVSKQIMSESAVPIVPGYFGDDQSDSLLQRMADEIG